MASRAIFTHAGELSRRQRWWAATSVIFFGRTRRPLSIFYFWTFVLDLTAVSAPYPFDGEFRKEPLGFLVLEPAVLGRIQENPIFTIYFNS
jgi:hypothetical protein